MYASKKIIFSLIAVVIVLTVLFLLGWFLFKPAPTPRLSTIGYSLNPCVNDKSYTTTSSITAAAGQDCRDVLFNKNLKDFPAQVLANKNLVELNLAANGLSSVPPEIGTMFNLSVLYLGNNNLTRLPPEIGNLSGLTLLSLFHNKLTDLPSTIANLKNLKVLGIAGNPMTTTTVAKIKAIVPWAQVVF